MYEMNRWIKAGDTIVKLDDVIYAVSEDKYTTLYFRNETSVDVNITIDELWSMINV